MRALVALAVLALASCQPDPFGRTGAEIKAEEAQCAVDGGRFEPAGITGARMCIRPTPDAGKACTNGTQCTGLCLANSNDGSGMCSAETPQFGCIDMLDERGERVVLCID